MSIFVRITLALAFASASLFASAADDADPPGRVARLNYLDGNVTFAPAGSDDWSYAQINRPLTNGDRLWVDKGGRAELHVGSTAIRAGAQTSVDVLTLDDDDLQLKLQQGSLGINLRTLESGRNVEIDTPNLAFVINEPGFYRIDVDPDRDTTRVVVRRGEGEAFGEDDNSVVLSGAQQVVFSGDSLRRSRDTQGRDDFDDWNAARDRREEGSASARYVPREVTGYEDLDEYGTWRDEPDYGPVWVPRRVAAGWAPYHYGHWAWIAPWGWTWVDDEPWGFAPFHYGRWAYIRGSWGWVPGRIAPRPVYAPALVAFASGGSGGTRWGISLSIGAPGVAWFALGPGEPYRPAYRASPAYVSRVNVNINHTTINNVYVNQRAPHAIAAMRADAFARGEAAQRGRERFDPRALRHASMHAAPEIAPVRQSLHGDARKAREPSFRDHARPVVAARVPATPAALHDELAQRYARNNVVKNERPLSGRPQPAADRAPAVKVVDGRARPREQREGDRGAPENRNRDARGGDERRDRPAADGGVQRTPQAPSRNEQARPDDRRMSQPPQRAAETAAPQAAPVPRPGQTADRGDDRDRPQQRDRQPDRQRDEGRAAAPANPQAAPQAPEERRSGDVPRPPRSEQNHEERREPRFREREDRAPQENRQAPAPRAWGGDAGPREQRQDRPQMPDNNDARQPRNDWPQRREQQDRPQNDRPRNEQQRPANPGPPRQQAPAIREMRNEQPRREEPRAAPQIEQARPEMRREERQERREERREERRDDRGRHDDRERR